MLWYKAWRETRTVALIGIAAMAAACLFIVLNQQTIRDHSGFAMTYVRYLWKAVYDSFGRDIFLIFSILLGSGGLLQEKGQGTVGFTLALPVSRGSILFYRALVGYCGVLAIAMTPALVLPLASRYVGQSYPVLQPLSFGVLWAGCGALFYGFTFLLAHVMEGEYSAILVAVPSLMLYGIATNLPWLARFPRLNVFNLINGEDMPFFNEWTHLFTGPMPWDAVFAMLLVAAMFLIAASRRMQSRDV